jgi:hypothetical protein
MNTKDRLIRISFILLEIIFGLSFGLLGVHIFSLFDNRHLETSIIHTFLIMFFSMLIGIGIVGFLHLKIMNRLKDFGKALVLCGIGLLVFLMLYILINSLTFNSLPHYISSVVLPTILPTIGAVLGFNFITMKRIK